MVVGMCSTEMRDSATSSLTKVELHINVLGACKVSWVATLASSNGNIKKKPKKNPSKDP